MRLVCVLFTFENNTGQTDGSTDGPTDGRTDTTSYRDATAHLIMKEAMKNALQINKPTDSNFANNLRIPINKHKKIIIPTNHLHLFPLVIK